MVRGRARIPQGGRWLRRSRLLFEILQVGAILFPIRVPYFLLYGDSSAEEFDCSIEIAALLENAT